MNRSKFTRRKVKKKDEDTIAHTKWECKYHIVFIPKYRKKVLYGKIRGELGKIFQTLSKQRESRIEEGHLVKDHVHMLVSIPPKIFGISSSRVFERKKCNLHC